MTDAEIITALREKAEQAGREWIYAEEARVKAEVEMALAIKMREAAYKTYYGLSSAIEGLGGAKLAQLNELWNQDHDDKR